MTALPSSSPGGRPPSIWDYLRDGRVLQVVVQVIFTILLVGGLAILWVNILQTLDARGLCLNFGFLQDRAGFAINDAPEWYSSTTSSYGQAFAAGVINTLRVVVLGLVGATVIGVLFGIFLLSSNWLVRTFARVYVEILRNTPLLVQLYFWYFIFILSLPPYSDAVQIPPEGVYFINVKIPIYILLALGTWLYAKRAKHTNYIYLGAAIGFSVVELALRIPGFVEMFGRDTLPVLGVFSQVDALADLLVSFQLNPLLLDYLLWAGGVFAIVAYASRRFFPQHRIRAQVIATAGLVLYGVGALGGFGQIAAVFTLFFLCLFIFASGIWRAIGAGYLLITLGMLLGELVFALAYNFDLVALPNQVRFEVYPTIYLSAKGIAMPQLTPTTQFAIWAAFVGLGLVLARRMWVHSGFVTENTGRPIPRFFNASVTIIGVSLIGWIIVTGTPRPEEITIGTGDDAQSIERAEAYSGDGDWLWYEPEDSISIERDVQEGSSPLLLAPPVRGRFNYEVGAVILPEYAALLIGLVIYTSAFIAEIVRAGIQAVPYGQIEAARALGLSRAQTLRMVILPQALRVIIPPMGNQYLNLAKNSTLATAIAFQDTYTVGQTVMNQSGQSITGFFLIFVVYISMSLIISLIMNIVNSRFQLVTR